MGLSKTFRRDRGRAAEDYAAAHLKRHGLCPLANNYRCRFGEIDLIMRDEELLVFVEVRARAATGYATPAETVTRTKQKKIIATAEHFLLNHGRLAHLPCRFDVFSVIPIGASFQAQWIKDAFRC